MRTAIFRKLSRLPDILCTCQGTLPPGFIATGRYNPLPSAFHWRRLRRKEPIHPLPKLFPHPFPAQFLPGHPVCGSHRLLLTSQGRPVNPRIRSHCDNKIILLLHQLIQGLIRPVQQSFTLFCPCRTFSGSIPFQLPLLSQTNQNLLTSCQLLP